ncbi:mechanosensitive ion channel family protein [Paracrocinitomix mangrovi]|uniref:mechanosensitive ion channel domain-containing protein n=1 Tax=Paracrocinitomix mangrovi TaxID=2862509 RepID=UPI001C8EFEFE|nr:mechanosensitive ion channel domain-containing protein [Paracrocinitomix mangrovi]UKN00446.1 mechanosensitive ion channel family protein [Paracrocinitomix mangrovi]
MKSLLQKIDLLNENVLLLKGAQFLIISIIILTLFWLIRTAMTRSISDDAMRYRAKKISRFFSYLLIIIVGIIIFAGSSENLGTAIGLISAGLAFALQEVILAVAGWISIYSSRIYTTGDRIELNGVTGDVIDIGLTKTTLMEIGDWVKSDNYNGRIVKISNAFVFKQTVKNYSTDFPFLWDEVHIPIKYTSDINEMNKILNDVISKELKNYTEIAKTHWKQLTKKYLIEDAKVDPMISYKLTDNWLEFNLRYVVDYKSRMSTKSRIYQGIKDGIDNSSGKVELASTTFEIVGMPELKVDTKK